MSYTTYPQGAEENSPLAKGKYSHSVYVRHIIEGILWGIGLLVLITASFFFHMYHGPLPGELEFSRSVQAIHLWAWILGPLMLVSTLNDIPSSIVAVVLWVVGLCLFRRFRQASFLALTVGIGNGINALIGDFVGRPRPTPDQIHVDSRLIFNSFPSGHTEHDVVYYGFLLYLSFSRPVREWRYRWLLLPLQILAIIIILSIGFSRIYEGEHWLTDVLGGYLSGALWLYLFIFIYRWVGGKLAERERKKNEHRRGLHH